MALSAALAGSLADAWSWLEFLACHEKQVIKRVIVSPVYALLALGSFFVSLRTRYSRGVVVRIQDVGFFSNYLAVLDACARVPPGATVAVDWRLSGDEKHFTYGSPGTNVWAELFAATTVAGVTVRGVDDATDARLYVLPRRFVLPFFRFHSYFTADMKAHWGGGGLDAVARSYHRFAGNITIRSPYVLQALADHADLGDGPTVGVHKRVNNFASLYQQGGVNSLDNDKYVAKLASLARFEKSRIYLATDDADAPRLFKDAFGERVVVRDGVSRVGEGHEVHMCEMNLKPATITEACDVLIDALLLAKCDVLVCGSSAVSLAVRFMKPAIETHYVRS